jgi:pimeloyl-ACP methyl ester carboxylesterase
VDILGRCRAGPVGGAPSTQLSDFGQLFDQRSVMLDWPSTDGGPISAGFFMTSIPTAQEFTLEIQGHAINVRQDGEQVGTAIVLIHAFAGSLQQWDDVSRTLASDHWVIRMDLLGHGKSAKPVAGYSMPDQAKLVSSILDSLGVEQCVVVGQSGGGNVVVAMLEDPQLRRRVNGAVIIGTPPNMSFVNLPAIANIYSVPVFGQLMWRITNRKMVSKTMAALFAPRFGPVPDVVVVDFFAMTRHSYVQAKANLEGFARTIPLSDRVAVSDVALHVVFGVDDQWIPARCTEVWSQTRNVTTELLPGVGHTPPLEQPTAVANLINTFVQRLN